MTLAALLRLLLVPAAVWLASVAGRRWGHSVSGYLGGLPMIGAPITLFLALDLGPEFAARSALFTLGAVVAQAAHLMAFAHVGVLSRAWIASLAAGWGAFAIVAIAVGFIPLNVPVALALALGGLLAAWRWLPREQGEVAHPAIPRIELQLRLLAAFGLAIVIVFAAPVFGPVVSGVLLSMPVTGSIVPPFTLALYGPGALMRLLRAFVLGLFGFSAFFLVIAGTLVAWGLVPSFSAAVMAALAALFVANRLLARVRR